MLNRHRIQTTTLALAMLFTLGLGSGVILHGASAARADQIGVDLGICVLLGEAAAESAIDLAESTSLTLYIQLIREETADALRQQADQLGLLGSRIYVETGELTQIHLADNLADAVVIGDVPSTTKSPSEAELRRVIRPRGKIIRGNTVSINPVTPGAGEWSHPYHQPDNNPLSKDQLVKAPYITQFLAEPYYGPMPEVTVTSGGRLFKAFGHISFKEREHAMLGKLVALNAYNGIQLWQRDLKPGYMIHRNTMIATPDTLYLADDDSCRLIDAATGVVRDEIVLTKDVADGPGWKWMALQDGVLYALMGDQEITDKVLRGERQHSGWPWTGLGDAYAQKEYPWGFGRTLLAIDSKTKEILWNRREPELIDSRGVCMKNGRIFIYSHQNYLTSVDATSGETIWTTAETDLLEAIGEHDFAQTWTKGYSSTVYLKSDDEVLYFAGPQRKRLVAASAYDGKLLWDMPDGNYQLVLREDAVYAMGRTSPSKKLDPRTGKVLAELDCLRGNCTRATGTTEAIFARGAEHGGTLQLTIADDQPHRIPAMRPACQDGVLIANGQLYWGPWMCDCNHSLVGIISLTSAGDFNFEQPATNERLERKVDPEETLKFDVSDRDWPTYRANNQRSASTQVAVPTKINRKWRFEPSQDNTPTAPVAANGFIFVSGFDGVVRAFNAKSGEASWKAYTSGPVRYPPTVAHNRVYVGSSDGLVYSYEASTGRLLWRFQAAPVERKIPVYGRLSSTWPVTTGVLVENGIAYAAAGIASHDGTHVYALDAESGEIHWQNNTSGNLMEGEAVSGVSVQGHLLFHQEQLYLAGGNVVSPAIYDSRNGECLNTLTDEWQKAPRGSELFLVDNMIKVVDRILHAPREYIPSRYYAKYLLQARSDNIVIQGSENAMMRIALGTENDEKPKLIWQDSRFVETAGVALTPNAVVVVGTLKSKVRNEAGANVLLALNSKDGTPLWLETLPDRAAHWGLAIDRHGQIIVTLVDGQVLCFGEPD